MNSTRIEMLGINKLEAALSRCPYLCPYLKENDRTPCWDGRIFVYYSENWLRRNLKGIVPVQVKTSCQEDLTKETVTFQVDMDDIRAYFNEGGVFFFVVYISKDGDKYTIYYASLLPFDLEPIIKQDKKSHVFHLIRFPEGDNEKIMNAFSLFLDNRPKQMPIITNGVQTFEEMCKNGVEFDSFVFSIPNFGRRNPYDLSYLSNSTVYIYAKPKGLNIDIPIQRITESIVSMTLENPVYVNGIEYYPSYIVAGQSGKTTLQIGQSFTITGLEVGAVKQKINFRIKGTLKQRITDMAFFSALLTHGSFTICGHDFVVHDFGDAERDFAKKTHQYYLDTLRMLDALGVNEDLDCDKISDNDDINIRNFISAVLYGKHIGLGQLDTQIVQGLFSIANLKIMILCRRDDQGYYSVDRFDSTLKARFTTKEKLDDRNFVEGPAYLSWRAEHFEEACNIDNSDFLKSISEYEATPQYCGIVNQAVLEILKAYDKQEKKNDQLLLLADGLCQWLLKNDPDENKVIAELNQLQTFHRQRVLTIVETNRLVQIVGYPNMDKYCQVGASILLHEYSKAREILNNLPDDENKAFFMIQPIMNLLPQ